MGECDRIPYEEDRLEEELPWEFLFYMATVPLQRSEEQFWDMSLRTLVSLIKQHERLERERSKAIGYMTAMFMSGHDPDEGMVDVTPKKLRKIELQMGNAMW